MEQLTWFFFVFFYLEGYDFKCSRLHPPTLAALLFAALRRRSEGRRRHNIMHSAVNFFSNVRSGRAHEMRESALAFKYKCVELECGRCVQSGAEMKAVDLFLIFFFFFSPSVPCELLAPPCSQSRLSHDRTDLNINARRPSLCETSKSYLLSLFFFFFPSYSWATLNA